MDCARMPLRSRWRGMRPPPSLRPPSWNSASGYLGGARAGPWSVDGMLRGGGCGVGALLSPLLRRRGWRRLLGRLRWRGVGSPEVAAATAAAAAAGTAGCGCAVCSTV